ncbi:hypothetical protein L484_012911 [Morus notabilis]|uniref:Uncharacterized protein n=1 Tax=Morus notabilis TaxID=981085 RepID=W9QZ09_9ROSA|nr:hypothetical protein L484_012911 [Morus notabilis]
MFACMHLWQLQLIMLFGFPLLALELGLSAVDIGQLKPQPKRPGKIDLESESITQQIRKSYIAGPIFGATLPCNVALNGLILILARCCPTPCGRLSGPPWAS